MVKVDWLCDLLNFWGDKEWLQLLHWPVTCLCPCPGPYLPRIMSHKDLTQPIWGQQENLISQTGKSLVYKVLQKKTVNNIKLLKW